MNILLIVYILFGNFSLHLVCNVSLMVLNEISSHQRTPTGTCNQEKDARNVGVIQLVPSMRRAAQQVTAIAFRVLEVNCATNVCPVSTDFQPQAAKVTAFPFR